MEEIMNEYVGQTTELGEQMNELCERLRLQEQTTQILLKSNKQIIDWVDDIVKDQEHFRENYFFLLHYMLYKGV